MVELLLELESHKEEKATKFTCIKCSSFCPYSENGNISTTLFTWLIKKCIPHIVHLDAATHSPMPQNVAYLIKLWKRGMAGATCAIFTFHHITSFTFLSNNHLLPSKKQLISKSSVIFKSRCVSPSDHNCELFL